MKLYTILFLMLFLGYPYPVVSGQVSAAEHKAILSEIENVEHKVTGRNEKIHNFKERLGILKTSLKKHKDNKNHYSEIRKQTKDVLDDIGYLRSKKIACHDGKCSDLERHLKSLKQTIPSQGEPAKNTQTEPTKKEDKKEEKKEVAPTTDKKDEKKEVAPTTDKKEEQKAAATDKKEEQKAAAPVTPSIVPAITISLDNNNSTKEEEKKEPSKKQKEDKPSKEDKKAKKVPPPPAPILPKKEATFYEKLKSALHEGKNDGEVEKILTDHIMDNDATAQERIFYPLQENDKTKHFFNVENPPSGGTDTGSNWLALLGMLLFGIAAGVGGLFAFLKRKKHLTSDEIKNVINDHFENTSLNNDLKQNIILNQMNKLEITNKDDKRFYENLCEKAIGQLDEKEKQAFLLKQVETTDSPNQHLPIAQSIVNQLDKEGKKELGIGTGQGNRYNEPATPTEKANQINTWLRDSKVKNHASLAGAFVALPPSVAPKGTYFLAEVLTAAGPRKTEESELGEDIAGMMMKDDYAIFWIMDGSSNYAKVKDGENKEIYSSRVLAMTLAEQVQILMRQKSILNGYQVKIYLKEAIDNTIIELNKRVSQPEIKRLLQQFAANGNNITVATTATLGLLHKNGDLWVCKIGDDKISASGETMFSKYGALVICDVQSESNLLRIDMAELKEDWYEEYQKRGVQTVVASSDGINDTIYKWIQNDKQISPDKIRRFKEHQNRTFDDKSLCIIQIINN